MDRLEEIKNLRKTKIESSPPTTIRIFVPLDIEHTDWLIAEVERLRIANKRGVNLEIKEVDIEEIVHLRSLLKRIEELPKGFDRLSDDEDEYKRTYWSGLRDGLRQAASIAREARKYMKQGEWIDEEKAVTKEDWKKINAIPKDRAGT